MKSLRRLCLPLLGALVAFLMVAGISSAATVTLADLSTPKTFFLNEGNFDHDLGNPLVITISDATWTTFEDCCFDTFSIGDIRILESAGGHLSDVVRFVNVNGVATIYFGSGNAGVSPATGPLSGPSPGFVINFTETTKLSSFTKTLFTKNEFFGPSVNLVITSDVDGAGAGSVSDHITLTAFGPQVPEPSTLTLAGLGALGLLIKSFRRRSSQ